MESTNLTLSKLNDIITHDNIGDNHAQVRLNATDRGTRDLSGADSILYVFLDDWEDNKLTDRDDRATTPSPLLGANEFSQVFRPEWTTESGSPSASGGVLVLTAGDATAQTISLDTTLFVGTWEFDVTKQADGTAGAIRFEFYSGGSLVYYWRWDNSDGYMIYDEVDGADVISVTHAEDTATHAVKITRASGGDWELFFDGASDGTATDATTTSIDEIRINNIEDIEVHEDDLKIY